MKQYEKALEDYEYVLSKFKSYHAVQFMKGVVLDKLGRKAEAREAFETFLKKVPDIDVYADRIAVAKEMIEELKK